MQVLEIRDLPGCAGGLFTEIPGRFLYAAVVKAKTVSCLL